MNDGPLVGVCLFPGSGVDLCIGCVALHTDFSGIETWVCSIATGATPEIRIVPGFEGGSFEFLTNARVVFVAIAVSTKTILVAQCTGTDARDCSIVKTKQIPALAVALLKINDVGGGGVGEKGHGQQECQK